MDKDLKSTLRGTAAPLFITCSANVPYNGCFHEPNYFVLNDGEVFPLYVSGKAMQPSSWNKPLFDPEDPTEGVELEKFIEYMESQPSYYDEWEIESLEELCVWENLHNTLTALLHNLDLPTPVYTCYECGRELRGFAKFLGASGNGGVGVNLSMPCCPECFENLRWCEACLDTVTIEEDKSVCPNFPDDFDPEVDRPHELSPVSDEAENFGMTGGRFLFRAEGPPPVIVIMRKGVGNE